MGRGPNNWDSTTGRTGIHLRSSTMDLAEYALPQVAVNLQCSRRRKERGPVWVQKVPLLWSLLQAGGKLVAPTLAAP
eukprot:gene17290-biopygen8321